MGITKREYWDLLNRAARGGTFPSVQEGRCLYRGPGHRKCSVGILIPEEDYQVKFDSGEYSMEFLFFGPWVRYMPEGMTVDDLRLVQAEHDSLAIGEEWNADEFILRIGQLNCFREFAVQTR